jgi:hypothetical protein
MNPSAENPIRPGKFSGHRAVKRADLEIDAPPSRVFPLLCPERERDWVLNWDYSPVFPVSGLAEQDGVFITDLPPEGFSVWAFTSHIPDRHLEAVRVTPALYLLHWSMDLVESGPGKTTLSMTWTVTGLSPFGNQYMDETLDTRFGVLMPLLEKSMNHYLETGKKISVGDGQADCR